MTRRLISFQFTHPGGVRLKLLPVMLPRPAFQFTHPGGVRPHGRHRRCVSCARFNSRTREGCDKGRAYNYLIDNGFNSRTREGCDALV